MIRKIILVSLMALSLSLLSACNSLEDAIDIANGILSQFSSDDEETTTENETNVEAEANADAEENENEADDEVEEDADDDADEQNDATADSTSAANDNEPFDDRLRSQGYDIYQLPNGISLDVPYSWILVDYGAHENRFVGMFCYDLPLDTEQVAQRFGPNYEVDYANFKNYGEGEYSLPFTADLDYELWNGFVNFYIDAFENTCANVQIDSTRATDDADSNYSGPGEDPSTMESTWEFDNDINEMIHDDDGRASSHKTEIPSRNRDLASEYEDALLHFRDGAGSGVSFLDNDPDVVESTGDKISAGNMEMVDLVHGFPVIFPYEWYLIAENDHPQNATWEGTFCTDASLRSTIVKHHDMLADLYADIYEFEFQESPNMNIKSKTTFAFNDVYGTGSWNGESLIYFDELNEYPGHKCAKVTMEFSPELLD